MLTGEAAKLLGTSKQWLIRLADSGLLGEVKRVGVQGVRVLLAESVRAYAAERRAALAAKAPGDKGAE